MDAHSKKTILFVLPWSLKHVGGVNQVVINLTKETVRAGKYTPIVFITDWNTPNAIWEVVQGVTTVRWRVRPYHTDMSIKERLSFYLWEKKFRRQFLKFCKNYQVASVNIHYPTEAALTMERIIKKLKIAVPFTISFHGTDVTNFNDLPASQKISWQAFLMRVKNVVVCSNELGQRLLNVLGDNIGYSVIYNGVSDMDVTQQTEAPISGNTRVILNIGKYEAQKGQDVLIRAFAEVGLDYKDIELIFVGATDKALESLKTLSQELGVINRVQFIQDVSFQEIPKYYRRATIFCLPSKKEGFPLVLLEAARFRVPIIASHVGGIPELISSGENGMLVSPDNPSELASALRLYLSQPVVAREMADRLFKIVELDFTWKKVYEKYEKLY